MVLNFEGCTGLIKTGQQSRSKSLSRINWAKARPGRLKTRTLNRGPCSRRQSLKKSIHKMWIEILNLVDSFIRYSSYGLPCSEGCCRGRKACRSYAVRSVIRVISGGTPSRTGAPTVPSPRLTYSCDAFTGPSAALAPEPIGRVYSPAM